MSLMIGWQTPADEARITRTLVTPAAVEHGDQMVAMLFEGIAPCHSGEAFRARLEPNEHGRGVCPVCVAPGGFVCCTCGMPTESEPCRDHQPNAYRWSQS